jgi:hypothetical protein
VYLQASYKPRFLLLNYEHFFNNFLVQLPMLFFWIRRGAAKLISDIYLKDISGTNLLRISAYLDELGLVTI